MTETSTQDPGSAKKVAAVNRWINILAPLYSLLVVPVLLFCAWQLHSIPQPREFEIRSDPRGAAKVAREMKSHLNEHPELTLFRDRWYFDMMHDSVVAPPGHDTKTVEQNMNLLAAGYRDVFETHDEILRYLTLAAIAGLFFSILVRFSPGFVSYTCLLLSSLAPQLSEFFTGLHLGHLLVYSLPFLIIALAIITLSLFAYSARRLTGRPELQKGWTTIAWGTGALLIGAGGLVWIFAEGVQVRDKTGTGTGLLVVYGVWGMVTGTKTLLADRKRRGENRSHETPTKLR